MLQSNMIDPVQSTVHQLFVTDRSVKLCLIKARCTDKIHCENVCKVVTYFNSYRTTQFPEHKENNRTVFQEI